MSPLLIIVTIVWALSALALIALVLLHSGKGTGLSETFGGSMQTSVGTGLVEKNLDRITIVCGVIFIATLVIFMLAWPVSGAAV